MLVYVFINYLLLIRSTTCQDVSRADLPATNDQQSVHVDDRLHKESGFQSALPLKNKRLVQKTLPPSKHKGNPRSTAGKILKQTSKPVIPFPEILFPTEDYGHSTTTVMEHVIPLLVTATEPPDQQGDNNKGGGGRHRVPIPKAPKQEDSRGYMFVIIMAIVGFVLLLIITSVIVVIVLYRRKKRKEKGPQLAKKPRKMEAAEIGATKFTHAGALVLDPRLKGPVKHALPSKETEEELPTLQFDPKLNEIVDIGSDVEVLKEEKYDSAEDEKGKTQASSLYRKVASKVKSNKQRKGIKSNKKK